jgi:hypothetical protein
MQPLRLRRYEPAKVDIGSHPKGFDPILFQILQQKAAPLQLINDGIQLKHVPLHLYAAGLVAENVLAGLCSATF